MLWLKLNRFLVTRNVLHDGNTDLLVYQGFKFLCLFLFWLSQRKMKTLLVIKRDLLWQQHTSGLHDGIIITLCCLLSGNLSLPTTSVIWFYWICSWRSQWAPVSHPCCDQPSVKAWFRLTGGRNFSAYAPQKYTQTTIQSHKSCKRRTNNIMSMFILRQTGILFLLLVSYLRNALSLWVGWY